MGKGSRMSDEILDIVDENDIVIGTATRKEAHAKGLLHREIYVWFITPDQKIIFQKRSMTKETNPGLLTPSVAAHVSSGQTYIETLERESAEELGFVLKEEDVIYLGKYSAQLVDPKTGVQNNSIRTIYMHVYHGLIEDLRIEEGESDGYVVIPISKLIDPSPELHKRMSYNLLEGQFPFILRYLSQNQT
jgi:isopentenyldiphosphate isomerase